MTERPPMMKKRRFRKPGRGLGKDGGFTLIELIVTLLILGLLFTMIASILMSVLEAKKKVEAKTSLSKVGQAVIGLMTRDLQSLYAYDLDKVFKGENRSEGSIELDSIQFVAAVKSYPDKEGNQSGMVEVGYVLKEREGRSGIYTMFRRESSEVDADPFAGGKYYEVYNFIRSLKIQYLRDGSWADEWKETSTFPEAVKIEITLLPDDSFSLPDEAEESLEAQGETFRTIVSFPVTPIKEEEGEGEGPR